MVSDAATNAVYVGWQERNVPNVKDWSAPINRAYVAVSTDGGATFGEPVDIGSGQRSPRNEFVSDRGPSLELAPDGSL